MYFSRSEHPNIGEQYCFAFRHTPYEDYRGEIVKRLVCLEKGSCRSEVESDDAQEMQDSHNQELVIGEFIEMNEQEQGIEELECLDPVQSEDRMAALGI
ncbi:hypothetical protein TNCV_4969341 [Trichonephila clavipes]|nr:hypothetical protein TNCV_4969341 [Trichonephila clavipes]